MASSFHCHVYKNVGFGTGFIFIFWIYESITGDISLIISRQQLSLKRISHYSSKMNETQRINQLLVTVIEQSDVSSGLHPQGQPPLPGRQGAQHRQFLSPGLCPGVPDGCHEARLWDRWQGPSHSSQGTAHQSRSLPGETGGHGFVVVAWFFGVSDTWKLICSQPSTELLHWLTPPSSPSCYCFYLARAVFFLLCLIDNYCTMSMIEYGYWAFYISSHQHQFVVLWSHPSIEFCEGVKALWVSPSDSVLFKTLEEVDT